MHRAFDSETLKQSNERLQVDWAVREKRMTPDEAEAWARENQRLPFYLAGLTDTQVMSEQLWRLPYAVIWITWRSPNLLEREVASHHFWREHVWRNPIRVDQNTSIRKAETALRAALLGGELNAFGNMAWNKDYLTLGPRRRIIRNEWTDLVWTRTAEGALTEPVEGEPRYLDAFVLRDDIIARWPEVRAIEQPETIEKPPAMPTLPEKRRPGSKPKQADRIKSLMRAMPREQLRAMKNAEMAALFKAAASYCGELRSEVETEPNSVQ